MLLEVKTTLFLFCCLGHLPQQSEIGLGNIEYNTVTCEIEKASGSGNKRNTYRKYTSQERCEIGKYAAEHCNSAAINHFKSKHLKESTVRTFKPKYHVEIKNAAIQKRSPKKVLNVKTQGRPILLKELDAKIKKFLILARNHRAVINTNIAIATANGFLKHSKDESLNHLALGRPWAQNLFRRMGFVRRFGTTGKVEIPEGVKREAELLYINDIVNLIETHNIPKSMVLNLDQTPLKYVPCGNTTLAQKSSSTVPIKGVSDKRMITGTFTVSLDGKFLPMQLIYAGKTDRSIPKVDFPKGFSLSANPKHFSNEEQSLKLLQDIIIPYMQKERDRLGLDISHPGLLIMDVFRGQTTTTIRNLLSSNDIYFCKVPANITNIYQPLDLTVNGYAKAFMERMFTEWFATQISEALDSGKAPEDIDITLNLSTLKLLQAKWIIQLYDEMTSESGKNVIIKGWEKSGIRDGIKLGSSKLPSLDPFDEVDPLGKNQDEYDLMAALSINEDRLVEGKTQLSSDESEWGDPNDDRNRYV